MSKTNYFYNVRLILLVLFVGMFISACGSSNDLNYDFSKNEPFSIKGSATKGLIQNGIVKAYLINEHDGVLKADAHPYGIAVRTNKNGEFGIPLPNSINVNSLMIKLTSDADTKMVCDIQSGCKDSQSGELVRFGSSFKVGNELLMTTVVTNLEQESTNFAHISPLSYLASARAEGMEGGLTTANILSSYEYVEKIMGLETGALQQYLPDITKLDALADGANPSELKTAIISAAFLGLLNSPDWGNISEILAHAANRIKNSGAITATNMGALPEVTLDDVYYYAIEISQGLAEIQKSPAIISQLNSITSEVQVANDLISLTPEIVDPVAIVSQPISVNVDEGALASFSVIAIGGGDIDYQWRKNGQAISEANSSDFQILHAMGTDLGIYDVIVSNDVGSLISLSALLSVEGIDLERPENSPPVALDDIASTSEDLTLIINVLENDVDPDQDALTLLSASVLDGSVSVVENKIRYIPPQNFNGTTQITYQIKDQSDARALAKVDVTVLAVNDQPYASADTITINEDSLAYIDVLSNDSDIDGDIITITGAILTSGKGAVHVNNVGENTNLRFSPVLNDSGLATILYTISDGHNGSASAEVNVNIHAVNDLPIAVEDHFEMFEDSVVSINVTQNDIDLDGDELSITKASIEGPYIGSGTVKLSSNSSLQYSPSQGFNGSTLINYTISDGKGGTASSVVRVAVASVNDAPIAVDDVVSTEEDESVVINALQNDSDEDGDAIFIKAAIVTSGQGSVELRSDNKLVFTPADDFSGTASVIYTLSDLEGETANASVTIFISPVNDLPVAVKDQASMLEDTVATIDVLVNDTDIDGDTLKLTNAVMISGSGQVMVNQNNALTYMPALNFNGNVELRYDISDAQGATASAILTVKVQAVNDLPVVVSSIANTEQGTSVQLAALENASDVDNDLLSVLSASANHGVLLILADGQLSYTPHADYFGADIIRYSISDDQGGIVSASIAMTVDQLIIAPSIQLSWSRPLERENGEVLAKGDIQGYKIAYGFNVLEMNQETYVDGAENLRYLIENLSYGSYFFSVATVDKDNVQGAFSTPVSIPVLANMQVSR